MTDTQSLALVVIFLTPRPPPFAAGLRDSRGFLPARPAPGLRGTAAGFADAAGAAAGAEVASAARYTKERCQCAASKTW